MRQFLKILFIAAALGFATFLFTAWRVTKVEPMGGADANLRFRAVYERFEDTQPMLTRDGAGNVTHHKRHSKELIPTVPQDLVVLAWRGPQPGLVQMRIPLWFLRMKGAALRYMFRKTGLDPGPWALSPDEIRDWGPGIIIDYQNRSDRVLIWAE